MISSIQINNFQSHRNTRIDFHKGLNVIIGSSDSGKSAVIRALRWLIKNRPLGNDFRSSWGGDTKISAMMGDDVYLVERGRTDKENYYEIEYDVEAAMMGAGERKKLVAFNQDVPEEVAHILNFDDLNFQYQMDAPFMISVTSGEVARMLNDVASLDVIDKTLANIESGRRKALQLIATSEETLTEQKNELERYAYLDTLAPKINDLKNIQELLCVVNKEYNIIEDTVEQLDAIVVQLDANKYDPSLQTKYDILLDIDKAHTKLFNDAYAIRDIIGSISASTGIMERHEHVLQYEQKVNDAIGALDAVDKIEKEFSDIGKIIGDINGIREQQSQLGAAIEAYEKQFHDLMPDECPLCGNKILEGQERGI